MHAREDLARSDPASRQAPSHSINWAMARPDHRSSPFDSTPDVSPLTLVEVNHAW